MAKKTPPRPPAWFDLARYQGAAAVSTGDWYLNLAVRCCRALTQCLRDWA